MKNFFLTSVEEIPQLFNNLLDLVVNRQRLIKIKRTNDSVQSLKTEHL